MKLSPIAVLSLGALAACQPKARVNAVHPAKADVEATVTTISSGTVEAQDMAALNFGVTGRVSQVLVAAGDRVKAGQLLAQIENADLRAALRDTTRERERAEKLYADKLVSQAALDDSVKVMEGSRAGYDRSVIRAPFDGIVSEMSLRVGELAGPQGGRGPIKMIDEKPRLVKGDIDEIDLSRVRLGQAARVRVPAARREPFPARVTRVVPFIDTTKEQDRTSQIELRLEGADNQAPVGASAEIEIVVESKAAVLAVPTRAVLGSGVKRYVYVARSGRLAKQSVEIGIGNYDRTEIIGGVGAEDVVALPGDDVELKEDARVSAEVKPWP